MGSPLDVLLADGVIDEVLGRLKSGKEADISLVVHRGDVVAAKIYKDRATRSFKNNAEYKEGRKTRNTRTQRAMDSGGSFGRAAAEEAWKAAEATALGKLVAQGVRVPRPIMFYEGVLLMELVRGADGEAAKRLIDVALEPSAAAGIYEDLRGQMVAMLCCDLIHGDLSPYNILAAAAGPTIIDFPQVLSAAHASRAQHFFQRDFDNVLRYCAAADPALKVRAADASAIWRAYTGRYLTPGFVPPIPRPPPPPRRHEPRRLDPRAGGPEPRRDNARGPEPRRGDARGPDLRGPDPRRGDARGPDPRGPDPRRGDARGPDPRGPDPRRGDARGPDLRGPDPRRGDARGPDPRGPDPRRGDARGPDLRGPDPRRGDARGPDLRGPDPRRGDPRRAPGPHPPSRSQPPGPARIDTRPASPRPPRPAPPPLRAPRPMPPRPAPGSDGDRPRSPGRQRRRRRYD
ncbi:MAG: hypothetical protein IPL61_23910 [Myxococcales bacterium]|nr:hypothetical protein [Myxococcales bacterium]